MCLPACLPACLAASAANCAGVFLVHPIACTTWAQSWKCQIPIKQSNPAARPPCGGAAATACCNAARQYSGTTHMPHSFRVTHGSHKSLSEIHTARWHTAQRTPRVDLLRQRGQSARRVSSHPQGACKQARGACGRRRTAQRRGRRQGRGGCGCGAHSLPAAWLQSARICRQSHT